ncbi:MAG TPA: transglycosylase SLT domain-containing protein [Xanthomonadaceae bacterium]|nr:transglycosylase SLT domain-containing protein [Xanthomonadaceae bacterium]
MPAPRFLPSFRALLLAALIPSLVACAGAPGQRPMARADDATINALYAVIDNAVERYQSGLQFMRDGDPEAGRQSLDAAVTDLAAAGSICADTAGCEPQRFMAAYHNLLVLRSDVLTGASEGFVEVETPLEGDSPIVVHLPEASRSINLLNGRALADIIEINGPVKAALHDWLTWMRPNLIDAYENYQFMRHLMWPAYEEAGLPEALLFGILAKESGGRVHAVSRAGAAGPLQFMYHTGLRFGLGRENGFDTRFDPAAATRANVAYLNEQFAVLNNNLELALAAYNGGEGRVQRLTRGARDKRFWNPEIFGALPRETQEYVPYVLAAAWLFLHPEDYGLEFPRIDGGAGVVELVAPMTLSELSVCLGQQGSRAGWFRTLRNLNARHDPNTRLAAGTRVAMPEPLVAAYHAQCVDGRMADLAAELQASRRSGGVAGTRSYVVQRGDTLSSIARRNGCPSAQAIARSNNIAAPTYLIRPGQRLTLSGCRS